MFTIEKNRSDFIRKALQKNRPFLRNWEFLSSPLPEPVFRLSFILRVTQRNFCRLNQFLKDREFRIISINYCQKGHFWTKTCGYFDH